MSAATILPERTVDAWVASYITGRYWRARLWAPTEQRRDEAYDLGVGLGALAAGGSASSPPRPRARGGRPARADDWCSKVFVLEHKGVAKRGGDAFVRLRFRQHCAHLSADAQRGGRLLYYVLPDPPWRGRPAAPAGTVPDVALHRTDRPGQPGFHRWAWTINVADLDAWLRVECAAGRLAWGAGGLLELPTWRLQSIPRALALRDFLSEAKVCRAGRRASDPGLLGRLELVRGLPADPSGWQRWQPPEGPPEPPPSAPADRARKPRVARPPAEDDGGSRLSWQTYVGVGPLMPD